MSTAGLAVVIFGLAMLGGLAPIALSTTLDDERMRWLTTLGGGFLLGSALLIVVPEGLHIAEESGAQLSNAALGAILLLGFIVMLLLEGFGLGHSVHEEHHDHADSHGHGHVHHPESAVALPVGLSIHAIADGLAIGAASAGGEGSTAALIAVAVLLHKVPAAFSLGAFATHERATRASAVRDVALFALVTPITLLLANWLLADQGTWLAVVMLLSAGTFLYVATVDTLPGIHSPTSGRRTAIDVVVGAGVFAVLLLGFDAAGLVVELH